MNSRYKDKRLSDMKDKQLYEAYPLSFLNEVRPTTDEHRVVILGEITRLLQSILPSHQEEPTLFSEYLHEDDLSDITMFITEKYYGLSNELKMREEVKGEDQGETEEDKYSFIINPNAWSMLPSDRATNISLGNSGEGLIQHTHTQPDPRDYTNRKYQHLYLTSNDKIEEGDWCLFFDSLGKLFTDRPQQYKPKEGHVLNDGLKKIIATTNKTISTCLRVVIHPDNTKAQCVRGAKDCCGKIANGRYKLPQIPDSFIKTFVEKKGKVGYVTLEMEEEECAKPHPFQPGAKMIDTFLRPKLVKGEIIIK